ncbi:MAG: cation diffusion facilitator family transporter [Frankiales bacterium]|nr:cation diffusion facilitator family transporter [Frankiales bacterium]
MPAPRAREHRESFATVLVAGSANLLIAVAKLVAGLLSGSAAMLSEAAHSMADTLNEVFLLAALRRSGKPADGEHPFGYGMERYFWSLLAAVSIFVLGAGFSVLQGVRGLVSPTPERDIGVALGVLAVALVLEGASLVRALWQIRSQRDGEELPELDELEPTVRAVAFEDGAAVVGVVLAASGLLLDRWLGTTVFDAVASLAIGVLLAVVAVVLGRQNQEGLIGRSLPADDLAAIEREIVGTPGVVGVVELMSLQLGPGNVLLAARVTVGADVPGERVARLADDVDDRVQERFPDVRHVFVDPTPRAPAVRRP